MAVLEDVPLDSNDAEVTFSKGNNNPNGIFCSKIKLLIVVVVFLVLVIIIIVLAALLGASQSSKDTDKGSHKSSPTSSPVPTTPGPEAWWQIRLPRDVVPVHYNLFLNITVDLPRFDGQTEIYVNVTRSTDLILVHSNSLNISELTVTSHGHQDGLVVRRHFPFKKNEFHVIQMESLLKPGVYVVKMKYVAFFDGSLRGLYRSTYKYPNGKLTNFAATQFEPVKARKAFPCFDEPALKATFNVTIAHRYDYIALSNMPIYKSEEVKGQTYDYFEKSVVMPTYLVAFVVGDFKYKEHITASGMKIRVYSRPSVVDHTALALDQANKLLAYFENYYNIKYSLPKLDMIALPDFGSGAMENWGLITYKERYLIWSPNESSESNKRTLVLIIAHELAHQWYGNIVTMKWWDDLWLNEGFATFMSYVAMSALHPAWGVRDSFVVGSFKSAIELDGLVSSHPVKVNVNGPEEIYEIFDAISYSKGAAILKMLEFFIGKATFAKGLTRYLNRHAFSNAVTDDLWQALNEENCVNRPNCVNIKRVMDTWTLQMGYPVIELTKQNPSTYLVTQKHFLFDEKANISESKYKSPFNYKWQVPFSFVSTKNKKNEIHWMRGGSTTIKDDSPWIKGNSGHEGYYIVNYPDANWKALQDQLNKDHQVLNVSDRAGLIFDAFTLAKGGELSYKNAFNMTTYIKGESHYVPWRALDLHLDYFHQILPSTGSTYKKLQKYLANQSKKQYTVLGFNDTGSFLDKFLRSMLLEVNCRAGVGSCIDFATRRFAEWMNNPQKKIAPNLRSLVVRYGVANGGVREWDFVYEQYKKSNSPNERIDFLKGLCASKEAWIIARLLVYAFDPTKFETSKIRSIAYYVAGNHVGNRVAWDSIRIYWKKLAKLYGSEGYAYRRLLRYIPKYFSSRFELNELIKFNKEIEERVGTQTSNMLQRVEEVKANVEWLEKNTGTIEAWLTKYLTDNKIE